VGRAGSTPAAVPRRGHSSASRSSGGTTSGNGHSRANSAVPDCSLQKLPYAAGKNSRTSGGGTMADRGDVSALKRRRL
jgi:hypothetical protein